MSVDIDAHNLVLNIAVVKTVPVFRLASASNRAGMLHFTKRSPSSRVGLDCAIQITEQPAFAIHQSDHAAVVRELNKRNVSCVQAPYEPYDAEAQSGVADLRPLVLVTASVCGEVLHAALHAAGVKWVRNVAVGAKVPADVWIRTFGAHVAPRSLSVLDISVTTTVFPKHDAIPLVCLAPDNEYGRGKVWPMLGVLGGGYGTVFLYNLSLTPNRSVRIEQTCIYAGGLTHWLIANGIRRYFPSGKGSVAVTRGLRRNLTTKAAALMRGIGAAELGQIRFEARTVVNHETFDGTWDEVIDLVKMTSLADVNQKYIEKGAKVVGKAILKADYIAGVRSMINKLNDPRWLVGVGTNASEEPYSSTARIADVLAQLGAHMGFRWIYSIGKSATWRLKLPSYEDVRNSSSIWDEKEMPEVPDAPKAIVKKRESKPSEQKIYRSRGQIKQKLKRAKARRAIILALDQQRQRAEAERAEQRRITRIDIFGENPPADAGTRVREERGSLADRFAAPQVQEPAMSERDLIRADVRANLAVRPGRFPGYVWAVHHGQIVFNGKLDTVIERVVAFGRNWRSDFDHK